MRFGFIRNEIEAFNVFNPDAKKLLVITLVFAMAFPFVIIFGSAFVLRLTGGNNTMAIIYNWGFFSGLIIGYFINGKVLKRGYDIRKVFATGMMLTVIPLSLLMFFGRGSGYDVIIYGLFIGTGNGIYWSCRNIVTYQATKDENRNFFTSVEQFIIVSSNALIPLLFGTLILGSNTTMGAKMEAYKYTSVVVVGITFFAAFLILKSNFATPAIGRFIYFKFHKVWQWQRLLTFSTGIVQAGFMVLMTLLILNVAGDEAVLGKIEFAAAIVSVITIYIVGRISKPSQRDIIMLAGAVSLLIGGIFLAFTIENENLLLGFVAVSFLGVVVMKIGQVIADPMIQSSFKATYLTSIEKMSLTENKNIYAYIMDNEFFLNGGRIFGSAVFLLIMQFMNHIIALKYIFIILALTQFLSAFLIRRLTLFKVVNK